MTKGAGAVSGDAGGEVVRTEEPRGSRDRRWVCKGIAALPAFSTQGPLFPRDAAFANTPPPYLTSLEA